MFSDGAKVELVDDAWRLLKEIGSRYPVETGNPFVGYDPCYVLRAVHIVQLQRVERAVEQAGKDLAMVQQARRGNALEAVLKSTDEWTPAPTMQDGKFNGEPELKDEAGVL